MNNYEKKFKQFLNEGIESVDKEHEIITQIRDVLENGYTKIKDPKTGKKMNMDSYSASAITQVYDAIKNPETKEKFVNSGLVGMTNIAFKMINEDSEDIEETEQIQEAAGDSPTEAVKEYVANDPSEKPYNMFYVDLEKKTAELIDYMKETGDVEEMLKYTDEYDDVDSFLRDVDFKQVFMYINDDFDN